MDVEQQPDRHQGGEHRGAAVGHHRQRYAGHRHDAEAHADVLERLEAEPAHDPRSGQPAEGVVGARRDPDRPPQQHQEQPDDQRGPDQSELLTGDREDEVGVLLRDEARLGLRAVEETLAEQSPVADGDPGLCRVVAGATWVEIRVHERLEAEQLVALEHAELDGRDGASDGDAGKTEEPALRCARNGDQPEDGDRQHEHRPQVGLREDEHGGYGGDRQRSQHVTVTQGAALLLALDPLREQQGHPGDHPELRELGGLDGHPPDHDPRAGPVDDGAERRQHEQQPEDRADVDDGCPDPHPAVVRRGDDEAEPDPDHDVRDVPGHQRRAVSPRQRDVVARRRPDEQGAEDEKGTGAADQQPVDALPDRTALRDVDPAGRPGGR